MAVEKVTASAVRFIKLGAGGRFEQTAIEDGRLYLDYRSVPDEPCRDKDWESVFQLFLKQGDDPKVARGHANQIQAFYEEPVSCLWVTFIDGDMWWTFADAGVTMCAEITSDSVSLVHEGPTRFRSCLGRWSNKNIHGDQLHMHLLPGYVTKTASGFRGTICRIDKADAVLRIINDETDPAVQEALVCKYALVKSVKNVVTRLYWKDFETLTDLIFQRSGWPRVSRLGGSAKLIEFELENPVTGERSFAQVKSRATQQTLDDYVARFERNDSYKQMFFVYHSAKTDLVSERSDIFVWNAEKVADMTVKTGLTDWVLERVQ